MFALCNPTCWVCSKGNTPKFGPKVTHPPIDLNVGDIRSQIAAEWLQIVQRSQWKAYRKLPSLFLMVSSLTPCDLIFPQKCGFHPYAPNIREWPYLCNRWSVHFMFGSSVGFSGTADLMALFSIRTNSRSAILDNFEWPYLRNGSRSTYIARIARYARSSLR